MSSVSGQRPAPSDHLDNQALLFVWIGQVPELYRDGPLLTCTGIPVSHMALPLFQEGEVCIDHIYEWITETMRYKDEAHNRSPGTLNVVECLH